MYESPIKIISDEVRMQQEDGVYKAVQKVGIDVDREELARALAYDRHQYEVGYADGQQGAEKHAHWEDSPSMMECVVCSSCHSANYTAQVVAPPPEWWAYCPCCGAKMDEEVEEIEAE